jgi:hypothetical protein
VRAAQYAIASGWLLLTTIGICYSLTLGDNDARPVWAALIIVTVAACLLTALVALLAPAPTAPRPFIGCDPPHEGPCDPHCSGYAHW